MKKLLQLGPFDNGWYWRYIIDGHIVDYGFDEDLKTAKQQARDALAAYRSGQPVPETGNTNLGEGK